LVFIVREVELVVNVVTNKIKVERLKGSYINKKVLISLLVLYSLRHN